MKHIHHCNTQLNVQLDQDNFAGRASKVLQPTGSAVDSYNSKVLPVLSVLVHFSLPPRSLALVPTPTFC